MLLATISSLNGHNSSKEPPPLARIMTSTPPISFNLLIAWLISKAAVSPWTLTGNILYMNYRTVCPNIHNISDNRTGAEVTTPIVLGINGIFSCVPDQKDLRLQVFSLAVQKQYKGLLYRHLHFLSIELILSVPFKYRI